MTTSKPIRETVRKLLIEISEDERQDAKEAAIRLSLDLPGGCAALIRDDLDVFAMRADGSRELIIRAKSYDSLWHEALAAIQEMSSR